ncbi:hypothetical protein ACRAWF_06705 [Streptomyces sp. L7]
MDKRTGIPSVVVAINFSWEFVHSFVIDQEPAQRPANFIWFFFDIIIVYQVVQYGKQDFPSLSRKQNFGGQRLLWGIFAATARCSTTMNGLRVPRRFLGMYSGGVANVGLSGSPSSSPCGSAGRPPVSRYTSPSARRWVHSWPA